MLKLGVGARHGTSLWSGCYQLVKAIYSKSMIYITEESEVMVLLFFYNFGFFLSIEAQEQYTAFCTPSMETIQVGLQTQIRTH